MRDRNGVVISREDVRGVPCRFCGAEANTLCHRTARAPQPAFTGLHDRVSNHSERWADYTKRGRR